MRRRSAGLGDGAQLGHGYEGSRVPQVHAIPHAGLISIGREFMYCRFGIVGTTTVLANSTALTRAPNSKRRAS